ncbi:hypothetical protein DIPPA_28262 [Diplonema papillatum]|nr:hypothetical protein DIPPA_28262 [Diplonema papillatum]
MGISREHNRGPCEGCRQLSTLAERRPTACCGKGHQQDHTACCGKGHQQDHTACCGKGHQQDNTACCGKGHQQDHTAFACSLATLATVRDAQEGAGT